MLKKMFFLIAPLLMLSCITPRPPLKSSSQALTLSSTPKLDDDLELASLAIGIEGQIASLQKHPDNLMIFGQRKILRSDYVKSLKYLLTKLGDYDDKTSLMTVIAADFDFYTIYGGTKQGETLVTSYFEPEIEGSLIRTNLFTAPLYLLPDDIVEIELKEFDRCIGCPTRLLGRIHKSAGKTKILPYYSRAEIHKKHPLPKKLILCWVTPVDAFFLQVQGSGTILLPHGKKMRLGYHGQNGRAYVAIGQFLTKYAQEHGSPLNSLHSIEHILSTLPPEKVQECLDRNPSYVFFRPLEGRPITSFGAEVVDGRTIATDIRWFPKGALAFLTFNQPIFSDQHQLVPDAWEKTSRFVLDQDTGGAIKGGAHIDLFSGRGQTAKQYAGVMKSTGQLWYLAPKTSLLASLSN